MKRLFSYLLFALSPFFVFAQSVSVTIADGLENEALVSKIEQKISAILTEVNAAQTAGRSLDFRSLGLDTRVQESMSMLWENCPFICTDEEIVESVITTGSGYQVRNIPLIMKPTDAKLTDDAYQEAVISFDSQGNIESFYLSLSQNLYMNVIRANKELTDLRRRQLILDYVEHFRTAYNQKDIKFLNQVFSDDALIITGHVVRQKKLDGGFLPDKVTYTKQGKKQYLTKLASVFQTVKYVKVTFDEIKVMRHPVNPNFYGVTLHQGYTTDRYHDDGYVFLLWDFTKEEAPQIHVRTWQPDQINGGRISEEDVFSLSDFDI